MKTRPPLYFFLLLLILGLLPGPAAHAQSVATNSGAWSNAATWNTPPVDSNSVVVAGSHTVSFGAGDAYTGGSSVGTGLVVGDNSGTGILNITGGTLSTGAMRAGDGSAATINQSGGTLNISGQEMLFGQTTTATLNVTGGTLNMTRTDGTGDFHIGHNSQSFLNISDTGVVNMTGWIRLLNNSQINVNGGTFNRNSGQELVVENSSINQTAGTTTIGNYALWLGFNGVTGTLNLSGGTFQQTGGIRMGALASGNGIVNQTGGTYEMGGSFDVWGSAESAYNLNGGTFRITAANAGIGVASGGMTFNINGSAGNVTLDTGVHNFSVTNSSVFDNAAATLTKTGAGTFTLGGGAKLQVVNGALAVEDGMLETATGLDLGIGGSASATMSGGTLRTGYLGGANLILGQSGSADFDLSGGTVDVGSQANTLIGFGGGGSATLTLSGGTFAASNNTTFVGISGGAGTVNVNSGTFSAHSLNVGGNDAAAGTLNLNGGTFSVADAFVVGANGTVNVNTGGTLKPGAGDNMTVENGGTVKFNGGGGTNTLNMFLGAGGTVDLNGQTIASGTWGNLIGNGAGATLKNSSTNLATISANNTLWLWTGGPNLTIDTGSGDIQIDSWITSAGMPSPTGIIKTGTNALVLTYTGNDYTGTTTVSAGSLIVNGNQSAATGAVEVAAGATLGGSGTIGGSTTISGVLAPGNSIGTLTVANDVTWNGGENWVFELGAAGPSIGSPGSSDLLAITAGNDFLKGTGSSFTFDFAGTGDVGWYKLVDWAGGGTTSFDALDFNGVNLASTYTSEFALQDNALYVNVVPEPSTYALLAAAAVGLGVHLRRRRNNQSSQPAPASSCLASVDESSRG
jgi:autotransporter-associated beta strand protein